MLIRRRRQPRPVFSWRQLAFEVFVVVLGVTLALGANELRQHFLDARQVRVATESVAAELQQNCDRLTQAQAYFERVIAEIDSVRSVDPAALEGGLQRIVQAVPAWEGYNPAFVTSAAYETAQATGALGLMPYDRALGLGDYYTFLELYQEVVRQATGAVLQVGDPTVAQVEASLHITSSLQRVLIPLSCEGVRGLRSETTETVPDSPALPS